MPQEQADYLNPNSISGKEKMLFENILNDFKIDSNASQPVSRSLNDYYFDIMETFGLESLLIGKVFTSTQMVVLFDAVTRSGEKMDVYYRNGFVRRVLKLSSESRLWRTAFLDLSNLRDRLYKEMIQDAAKLKSPANSISPEDADEVELIRKIDEALGIATKSMIHEYAD